MEREGVEPLPKTPGGAGARLLTRTSFHGLPSQKGPIDHLILGQGALKPLIQEQETKESEGHTPTFYTISSHWEINSIYLFF